MIAAVPDSGSFYMRADCPQDCTRNHIHKGRAWWSYASAFLIGELQRAGAPLHILTNARLGAYDPFRSPLTFPKMALLDDLVKAGLHDLARRVIAGEFY